jgi:glutathione S-transferase
MEIDPDILDSSALYKILIGSDPFGRIPDFQHGGFCLYEKNAIGRYIDDAFAGSKLQPTDAKACAKGNHILGVMDAYAYRALVWDIYVERVVAVKEGGETNDEKIAAALPLALMCMVELDRLCEGNGYMVGSQVSIADLYVAPMFVSFTQAYEADPLMDRCRKLTDWWHRFSVRESMVRTQP